MGAETFKISGGALVASPSTAADNLVLALAQCGITATNSSGVLTITNSTLASTTNGTRILEDLVRLANAAGGAKIAYVVSS